MNTIIIKKSELKNKLLKQEASKLRFVWICLAPILLFFLVFSIVPIIWDIIISFQNYNLFGSSTFSGFNNYIRIFNMDKIGNIFINTFVFAIVTSVLNICISLFVSYTIYTFKSQRVKDFFRTTLFLPVVLPIVAISYIWIVMFDPMTGIVNILIKHLGYKTVIFWLQEPKLAMVSIIMITLFVDVGYNLILLLTGLENIPKTFKEAALIDGAKGWKLFTKVILPLLSRTMLFVCTMTVISYFQVFNQIHLLTRGGPDLATEVLSYTIYKTAFTYTDYGLASSVSIVLLIIILIITQIQIKVGKSDWEY